MGLFVLGALTLRLRKHRSAEQREAIIVFGALLVAAAFLVFGDVVVGKITQQGFRDESRMAVYMITMRSILDAPLLGYGYGTFADVFPMFRDQSVSTFGAMANGSQHLSGSISGTGPAVWIDAGGKRRPAGLALRQRGDDAAKNETMPCVAAGVAFLLGVHSLVDFSLQMQAIAITFMALLGAGVAQSESSRLMLGD